MAASGVGRGLPSGGCRSHQLASPTPSLTVAPTLSRGPPSWPPASVSPAPLCAPLPAVRRGRCGRDRAARQSASGTTTVRSCATSTWRSTRASCSWSPGRTGVGQVHAARRRHRPGAALHRRHAGRRRADRRRDDRRTSRPASARTSSATSARTRRPASSPTPSRRSSPTAWSSSGSPADTMRRRVEETLDLLGIADLRSRDLRTLSGGEQQRVAIGSVLTMHPRLLVLDEPTSALDPTAAEEVLATLTRLVHDLGLSVLLAEHRLERVVPFADRLVLLSGDGTAAGRRARRDRWPTRPSYPRSSSSAAACAGSPLPLTVRDARRLARGARTLGPPPPLAAAGVRRAGRRGATGSTVVRGATVAAPARSTVRLRPGTVTALMGRNGSGKSTLLWTLQGSRRAPCRTRDRRRHGPRRAGAPRAGARWSAWCRRPPPTCSTSRPSPRSALAADGGSGDGARAPRPAGARHPRRHPPARPVRGAAAGARARRRARRRPAGAPARRADPRAGLPGQGRARGGCSACSPTRATRCWSRPTTWSSPRVVADQVVVLAEGEVVSAGPYAARCSPRRRRSPRRSPRSSARGWLRVDEVPR